MVISDGFYNYTAASEAVAARTAVITATGTPFLRITPLAGRIAADRGIDLHLVQGSGYSGKIFTQDLDSNKSDIIEEKETRFIREETQVTGDIFKQEPLPAESEIKSTDAMVAAVIAADESVSGVMRMNEARHMAAAQTVKSSSQTAAVTQHMETDVTELLKLQSRLNADKEAGACIPVKAFYLKALAICVKEKERLRLRLAEAEDAYLLIDGANIGLQYDTGDGVIVPVLREADIKSLEEITSDINAITEKVKRSALPGDEARRAAITLLDKGDSGIFTFTPIINQPEAAILGIGSIYKRLVMTEHSIENKQFIMQSLTFDHRILNGAEADDFQKRLKEIIEEPGSLIG